MAEVLTQTIPTTFEAITTWKVAQFYVDPKSPSVKVEFESNTGTRIPWRYVVSSGVTEAQVKAAISSINQGKFMAVQGKSLEKWLIQQAQAAGILPAGSVSGTVD